MASKRDVFPHITSVSFRSKITQKWEKCQPPLIKSSLRDVTLPQKELQSSQEGAPEASRHPRTTGIMAFTSSLVAEAEAGREASRDDSHFSDVFIHCSRTV